MLFLHAVSRWQLSAVDTILDPLDPYFGEPTAYRVVGPERDELLLHPSRVVRFLGNPLPDPLLAGAEPWSDSILQSLYDAIHAVAVTGAGATSLVHEAKVDIVTVPGLSEHLSNAATTAQLSARFSYAAAMTSINNLLLLGDGESWARQSIDFAGLPEMVRTFLQVAAGAADIPVTRLLGQSPAGLSATGDSDTRNYYDMIAARQELDLRPQLERLDALLLRSAGVDPGAVRFAFRPLWQLSASERAAVALQKAQTTAVYAGLTLWPAAVTAALVQAQLMEDGTYPNAAGAFGVGDASKGVAPAEPPQPIADFDPDQARDPQGRWTNGGGAAARPPTTAVPAVAGSMPGQSPESAVLSRILSALHPISIASAQGSIPEEESPKPEEEIRAPEEDVSSGEASLTRRYKAATQSLAEIAPRDPALVRLSAPGAPLTSSEVEAVEAALRQAVYQRTCDFVRPDGKWIGDGRPDSKVRGLPGGLEAAQDAYDYLSKGGTEEPFAKGSRVTFPGQAGTILLRPKTSTKGSPAVDINVPSLGYLRLHFK